MGLGFLLLVWIVLCGFAAVPVAGVLAYWSRRNARGVPGSNLPRAVRAALLPYLLLALGVPWFAAYGVYSEAVRGVDAGIGNSAWVPLSNGYVFCLSDGATYIVKNQCGGVALVDGIRQVAMAGDLLVGSSGDASGFVLDTRTGGVTRLRDSAAALARVPAAAPLHSPEEFYFARRYGWPDVVAVLLLVVPLGGLAWQWYRRYIRAPAVAVLGVILVLPLAPGVAHARPIWARGAIRIDRCDGDGGEHVQQITSPDRRIALSFRCDSVEGSPMHLRVVRSGDAVQELRVATHDGMWRPGELLWAPDSSAFVINGGANAYAGYAFIVYRITANDVVATDVTDRAQRDMVAAFPPCAAANADPRFCQSLTAHPAYNMSVLAWSRGTNAVIVFAEIPCSSGYGGIACQIRGYELEARTGQILERMPAHDVKQRYQSNAAWKIEMPRRSTHPRAAERQGTGRFRSSSSKHLDR